MADDSESERPPTDPDESDESDDSTPDADETESSQTPTDGDADADDAESDGSAGENDADGGEDAADENADEPERSDRDGKVDADTDATPDESADRPDIAATSDGRPDAETDPDEVDEDDVTLEREGLVPPPDEERATDPADEEADVDGATADPDPDDDPDSDSDDAADPDDDPDSDSDDAADENDDPIWPEGHEYPDTEAAERREVADDTPAAVADTDGGAPTSASTSTAPGQSRNDFADDDTDVDEGMFGDGPESDQEMPLAEHIEEMVNRLAAVFLVGGLITLVLYPGADLANSALNLNFVSSADVINFLWNKHIPGAPEIVDRRPRVYGPLELVLTELKVAGLAGLIVGLPVFVYQTYLFMRPGLFPRERRYYLAAVPTSLILAFVGVAFAHFIVLPAIFAYFTSYTTGTAVVAFGLKETFNLILILMGYNAIIFQIPLFIMLAIMMNLVTREWLVQRRLIFWASFLGLAFFVSPDPTGMAPIIVGATMITLFEGTLFLLRWTGRGSLVPTAEGLAAYRPHVAVFAALVGYFLSPLPAPTGYYDLLPAVVTETLAANDLAVYTPLIIAGALVGAFELASLLLRRYGRSRRMLRARLAVSTARRPVWLVAIVVGYLGSPDPVLLRWAAEPSLRPALAGGIAVGLVLGYEALRLLLASREDRAA